MKACLVIATCVAALTLPAGALAASCAPPGNSGVDQYFETVPGASCNQPSSGPGSGHGGGHGGSLPAGTGKQLAAQGATGRAVERLVASTGTAGKAAQPSGGSGAGSIARSHHRVTAAHATAPAASGSSLLSGLLHPILVGASAGGTGVLLPLFLALVLLAVIVGTVMRRRKLNAARRLSS